MDLLNEPEWDGNVGERTWIPWAEELAAAWRARDPYGHPVTVADMTEIVQRHLAAVLGTGTWRVAPVADLLPAAAATAVA